MLQNVSMTILSNSLSVALLDMTGLVDKVNVGNSVIARNLKNGAFLAVSEDAVDWWLRNDSLLLSMRLQDFVDKSISNGVMFYGADMLGLDDRVIDFVRSVSPFPDNINDSLAIGVLLTAFISIRDMWETSGNSTMVALNHPTRILTGGNGIQGSGMGGYFQ